MHIERQIREFMKRYINERIELIKSVSHKRVGEKEQMPRESMRELTSTQFLAPQPFFPLTRRPQGIYTRLNLKTFLLRLKWLRFTLGTH